MWVSLLSLQKNIHTKSTTVIADCIDTGCKWLYLLYHCPNHFSWLSKRIWCHMLSAVTCWIGNSATVLTAVTGELMVVSPPVCRQSSSLQTHFALKVVPTIRHQRSSNLVKSLSSTEVVNSVADSKSSLLPKVWRKTVHLCAKCC